MNIEERYCILDIETWNEGREGIDPNKDLLRYVGFKYKNRKVMYHYTQIKQIQKCVDFFDYFVGHNIKEFDKVVLERYGVKFHYKKVIVDTLVIANNRLKSMMYIDLNEGDKKLSSLCDMFNLENKKSEYDYTKLEKELFEGDELEELRSYLYDDLDATDSLFKFFYEFFYGFRKFMNEENQRRLCWLINRPGSTAYKCICNIADLKEEYQDADDDNENEDTYSGGFVSDPYCDFIEG